MVHLNTELLTDYWRARRPAFGSPPRSSIDPTEFIELLPQVFILGRRAAGRYSFRLVGGLPTDLHGRRLQGEDFLDLWLSPDRASLRSAMETAARRSDPLIVHARGRTREGLATELEILLAPVSSPGGGVDRFLGLYQPLTPLARLLGQSIDHLVVQRYGAAGDKGFELPTIAAPRLRLAAVDGRRIA